MAIRVGINGFGRIGRIAMRRHVQMRSQYRDRVQIVAINDPGMPARTAAHLLQHDSTHGLFNGEVAYSDGSLIVNQQNIRLFDYRSPSDIPWGEAQVDIVLECSGRFTRRHQAAGHLRDSVKKVIISAPSYDPDKTIVYSVNEAVYEPQRDHILSIGSCTTTCLAPIVDILHRKFKIRSGQISTTHAMTSDQMLLDGPHADLRRARSAVDSIIPTTTGAASAIGEVLPELRGLLDGISLRNPVTDVSVLMTMVMLGREVTVQEINEEFEKAASGPMSGLIMVDHRELISKDYLGYTESAIIVPSFTSVMGGNHASILAFYDNEWNATSRMIDLVGYIAQWM